MHPRVILRELIGLLSGSVGLERSVRAVQETCLRLGLDANFLDARTADNVLEELGHCAGAVGAAARAARARPAPFSGPPTPPAPNGRATGPRHHRRTELVNLLAPSLGREKADEAIELACRDLGVEGADLSLDEALAVLEHLAAQGGFVAVIARFAKARLALTPPPSPTG